jgi:hypothetical protein
MKLCGSKRKGGASAPPNFFYFYLKKDLTLEGNDCILLVDVSNDANAKRTEDKMDKQKNIQVGGFNVPKKNIVARGYKLDGSWAVITEDNKYFFICKLPQNEPTKHEISETQVNMITSRFERQTLSTEDLI